MQIVSLELLLSASCLFSHDGKVSTVLGCYCDNAVTCILFPFSTGCIVILMLLNIIASCGVR